MKIIKFKIFVKIVQTICLLLITSSVFYYFVFFVPKRERVRQDEKQLEQQTEQQDEKRRELLEKWTRDKEFLVEQKAICSKMAEEMHARLLKNENGQLRFYSGDPRYTYNSAIKTCIYQGIEYAVVNNIIYEYKFVRDVYTNEDVFYYKSIDRERTSGSYDLDNLDLYDSTVMRLMGGRLSKLDAREEAKRSIEERKKEEEDQGENKEE